MNRRESFEARVARETHEDRLWVIGRLQEENSPAAKAREERDNLEHVWELFRLSQDDDRIKSLIYFVRSELTQLIKIGITGEYKNRIRALECGTGGSITRIALFRGSSLHEMACHRCFNEFRTKGEWFRRDGILDEFLTEAESLDAQESAVQ